MSVTPPPKQTVRLSTLRAIHENKQVIFDILDTVNLFLFVMLCLLSHSNLVKFIFD